MNMLRQYIQEVMSASLLEGAENDLSREALNVIDRVLGPRQGDDGYKIEAQGNQIKVKTDARQEIFALLTTALAPLGFVHNELQGGSLGRLEAKRGKEGAYVVVKPMSSAGQGHLLGMEYEDRLASSIGSMSDTVTATTAGFEHGSDLVITGPAGEMSIEVKTSLGADFGQFSMAFDPIALTWEPIRTRGYTEHESAFAAAAKALSSNVPPIPQDLIKRGTLTMRNGMITGLNAHADNLSIRKELQSALFGGSNDIQFCADIDDIASYYASKGDKFIQIGKKGLYSLNGDQIPGIKVPLFARSGLKACVRFRIKPSSGALGAHRFNVAMSLKGRLSPSPVNLENPADVKRIISLLGGEVLPESLVRESIRARLSEFQRTRDLVSVIARMQVRTVKEEDPTVPDVLTNMRAAPGIVVVKQLGAIRRAERGREHLDVEIKYMPDNKNAADFLPKLGKTVKNVVGVEIVRLLTLGGYRTTQEDGTPWVF